MDIWVVSTFWLLGIMLLWTWCTNIWVPAFNCLGVQGLSFLRTKEKATLLTDFFPLFLIDYVKFPNSHAASDLDHSHSIAQSYALTAEDIHEYRGFPHHHHGTQESALELDNALRELAFHSHQTLNDRRSLGFEKFCFPGREHASCEKPTGVNCQMVTACETCQDSWQLIWEPNYQLQRETGKTCCQRAPRQREWGTVSWPRHQPSCFK